MTRLEGQRLTADLEDCLPDYKFAFEGSGGEGMYYYSDATHELNAEMGDMLHKIHDFEVATMQHGPACNHMSPLFLPGCGGCLAGSLSVLQSFMWGKPCLASDVAIFKANPEPTEIEGANLLQGTLCTELVKRVAAHGASLAMAVSTAAEIDCLISLAMSAADFNFKRPVLTAANELHIKGGKCHGRAACSRQSCMCQHGSHFCRALLAGHVEWAMVKKQVGWHINMHPAQPKHGEQASLTVGVARPAGRHMLTELVVDTCIPNDTAMFVDSGRVQVSSCVWLLCDAVSVSHNVTVLHGPAHRVASLESQIIFR